jgi:uncharacterized membrane protein
LQSARVTTARVTFLPSIAPPLSGAWTERREVADHRRTMMGLFFGGFVANIFIAFIPGRTMWSLVFG